jgi:hypothetical protein
MRPGLPVSRLRIVCAAAFARTPHFQLIAAEACLVRGQGCCQVRCWPNEKPDLCAAATRAKVRPYHALPRHQTAAKDILDPLERCRFASGFQPGGGNLSVVDTGYFFFLEVFFATFLVAALAVFFAFLAMSSSVKKNSMNMRTPCIDMHTIETISQMQN